MTTFVHHVEMKLSKVEAFERLSRIESWCAEWDIGFKVVDRPPGSESVRLAFEEQRLARAFVGHFGGVIVEEDEFVQAMDADAEYEEAYERFAAEYAEP